MIAFFIKHGRTIAFGLIAAGVLLGAFTATLIAYGNARYEAGHKTAEAAALEQLTEAQEAQREAERQLSAANIRLNEAIRERDVARSVAVRRTREAIANATDVETRYAAYLELRRGLRQQSAERHAWARADYLSTVAPPA